MAGKEVQVYFKVPRRPQTLLDRLKNSFLESVIEFKPVDAGVDPWRTGAFGLESAYQVRGNVSVIDEEILIQFVAKNAGIHTARIFANTREICHPMVFVVTQLGQVQSYDSFMSAKKAAMMGPECVKGVDTGFHSAISSTLTSGKTTLRETTSQPSFWSPLTEHDHYPPEAAVFSGRPSEVPKPTNFQRSRPPSLGDQPSQRTSAYVGDLFGRTSSCTFDQLYSAKQAGRRIQGVPSKLAATIMDVTLTQGALRSMDREAKVRLAGNLGFIKARKRCNICSRKVKAVKSVRLWDTDYCDSCCKRSFILRSAIEHFMPPVIQECTVQIPVNKKGTKFATTRKMMPNVNLRGLEPTDIRNAQMEFTKFDMEGDGWIDKAVLMPVVKACFTYSLPAKEIRILLSSETLKSMIKSMGLDEREKVHEVEFLSILAFIARERQRIKLESLPNSKFSHNDLQMAYAFQSQFGISPEAKQMAPIHDQQQLPSHVGVSRDSSFNVPLGLQKSFSDSPLQYYQPVAAVQQVAKNSDPNQPFLNVVQTPSPNQPAISRRTSQLASSLDGIEQALMGLAQTAPHGQNEQHANGEQERERGEVSDVEAAFHQEPLAPISSLPLSPAGKTSASPKQMMEELKLTGDMRADAWMMY